jgi:tetratricopeptide (TPR) repeat protein
MRRICVLAALAPVLLAGCDKIEARDHVRDGNAFYQEGRYDEAIAAYQKAEELEPDGVTVLWNRACAAESVVFKLKDATEEADLATRKEAADMALQAFQTWHDRLEPKEEGDTKALEDHKLALLTVDRRCNELVAHWENELRKDPQNEGLYVNVAKTHEEYCGSTEKADEWYQKRTEDFPQSARAWYELAVRAFEPLRPDPETGLGYNANLNPSERMRIADKVIGYLDKATEVNPQNRDPYVWRAMAFTQRQFARVYLDPPAGPEDRLEALNARQDSMLAWKEQKAVCDIDKIDDCALIREPEVLFSSPDSFKGKEVEVKGKVVGDIGTVDAAKHVYTFTLAVELPPEGDAPPPPKEGEGEGDEPPKNLKNLAVNFTFELPKPVTQEDGTVLEPDLTAFGEDVKKTLDTYKGAKAIKIVGELDASGEKFAGRQRPPGMCCPEAPLDADAVAADRALRSEIMNEIAAAKAAAAADGDKNRGDR